MFRFQFLIRLTRVNFCATRSWRLTATYAASFFFQLFVRFVMFFVVLLGSFCNFNFCVMCLSVMDENYNSIRFVVFLALPCNKLPFPLPDNSDVGKALLFDIFDMYHRNMCSNTPSTQLSMRLSKLWLLCGTLPCSPMPIHNV